jgi:hypothetical protein
VTLPEFSKMPSIPRLFREVIVTEKVDGTNASIFIGEDYQIAAASRTRWITPKDDNYGFAKWVEKNSEVLKFSLGPGHHFGEWFGSGIQRGYGLVNGDKRFALFNVSRWLVPQNEWAFTPEQQAKMNHLPLSYQNPELTVVPVIARGTFDTNMITNISEILQVTGSEMVDGYMKPEGLVVFHTAGEVLFKYTFEKNDGHKGDKNVV